MQKTFAQLFCIRKISTHTHKMQKQRGEENLLQQCEPSGNNIHREEWIKRWRTTIVCALRTKTTEWKLFFLQKKKKSTINIVELFLLCDKWRRRRWCWFSCFSQWPFHLMAIYINNLTSKETPKTRTPKVCKNKHIFLRCDRAAEPTMPFIFHSHAQRVAKVTTAKKKRLSCFWMYTAMALENKWALQRFGFVLLWLNF